MWRFLVGVVLCLVIFSFVYADDTLDYYIAAIESKQASLSWEQRIDYQKKTLASLSLQAFRSRNDPQHLATIARLKTYIADQLSLWSSRVDDLSLSTTTNSLSFLALDIPRVDSEKVRLAWLQWHNQERALLWKDAFVYHPHLESTAMTWANYLARIKWTTHRRNPWDSYYNYNKIKQRFVDQGIVFVAQETSGQSLFTENLWWNVYSCKKSDCTSDFIAAMKKTRLFFLGEKGKSYRPHYNAIVGDYVSIWLGIAFVGNKYYLVSHYTQPLE